MTTRAPSININHDPRFVAAGSEEAKKVENNLTGKQAMGAYVALELRVRGCVVIHGSSFWSKMACQLKQSSNGVHMLSWETNGDGDEHVRLWRAFAVYGSSCSCEDGDRVLHGSQQDQRLGREHQSSYAQPARIRGHLGGQEWS